MSVTLSAADVHIVHGRKRLRPAGSTSRRSGRRSREAGPSARVGRLIPQVRARRGGDAGDEVLHVADVQTAVVLSCAGTMRPSQDGRPPRSASPETSRPGAHRFAMISGTASPLTASRARSRARRPAAAAWCPVRPSRCPRSCRLFGDGVAAGGRDVVGYGVLQRRIDLVDLGERLAISRGRGRAHAMRYGSRSEFQIRDTTIRMSRIRPRVCWKPWFSRNRA